MSSRNQGKASDLAKMEKQLVRSGAKRQKRADVLADWQRRLDARQTTLTARRMPSNAVPLRKG